MQISELKDNGEEIKLKVCNIDNEEDICECFDALNIKDRELERAKDIFIQSKKFGLEFDLTLDELYDFYCQEYYDIDEVLQIAFFQLINNEITIYKYYEFKDKLIKQENLGFPRTFPSGW